MRFFALLCLSLITVIASLDPQKISSRIEKHPRIIHGEPAAIGQFSYQVGLLLTHFKAKSWCGGALISEKWILTAAHCSENVLDVTVIFGTTSSKFTDNYQRVSPSNFIKHPLWKPNAGNDIALLLINPVKLSSNLQIVELPSVYDIDLNYIGQAAIISGWGRTSDAANNVADHLQWGIVNIAENKVCENWYGHSFKPSMLCVSTKSGVSTCNGDSGGPLVLKKERILIGITSFGDKTGCQKNIPVVFTLVNSYLPWIKDVTGIAYY